MGYKAQSEGCRLRVVFPLATVYLALTLTRIVVDELGSEEIVPFKEGSQGLVSWFDLATMQAGVFPVKTRDDELQGQFACMDVYPLITAYKVR